jgi:hypothetical protein
LVLDGDAREEATQQQAAHMEMDPREGLIQEWLDSPVEDEWDSPDADAGPTYRDRVCAAQIWTECLGNKKGSMRPWEGREICDILRRIPDWEERSGKARVPGYGVQRVFECCR